MAKLRSIDTPPCPNCNRPLMPNDWVGVDRTDHRLGCRWCLARYGASTLEINTAYEVRITSASELPEGMKEGEPYLAIPDVAPEVDGVITSNGLPGGTASIFPLRSDGLKEI